MACFQANAKVGTNSAGCPNFCSMLFLFFYLEENNNPNIHNNVLYTYQAKMASVT